MKTILAHLMIALISAPLFAINLQQHADQLVNHIDPSINMGALVVDLNTGETLYQRNANRTFTPASNMKLFSDAAALLVLGPDYQFKNQLSTNAPRLDNGTLQGSLYIHLPGDPSFTSDHLESLFVELQRLGVRQVNGNVILASSHRHIDPYAPGWMTQDLAYSYGAPLSPLMLDENRLLVTVNPGAKPGEAALVELGHADGITLINQVKTNSTPSGCGLSYIMDAENTLTVRGCIGVSQWASVQRIAIRNPLRYAQGQIKARLAHVNIALHGDVVLGSAPPHTLLLATHASKRISQLMVDTLKPSDNLYADSLFLHAANTLNGSPLNWPEAQPVIIRFLQQQTGVSFNQAILTDGSGLSRNDRLTAQQTVGLLSFLHARFPLSYEYIAALPIAGQDGTLQKRLKKPTQQGFVRAKTGSMTGVVSLAGYLYTANAHTLAFALFINKRPGTHPNVSGRYRSLVDGLCDFFLQQKPNNNHVASLSNAHARVSFQQRPTHAEALRNKLNRWRGLESAVKLALKDQPVSVLFRGDQLVLNDKGSSANSVWNALQLISKKYTFSIALQGESAPSSNTSNSFFLWIKGSKSAPPNQRTWTLREST